MKARWISGASRRTILSLLPATMVLFVADRPATAGGSNVLRTVCRTLAADPEGHALGVSYAAKFPGMGRGCFERIALEAIGADAHQLSAEALRQRIRDRSAQDFRAGRIERVAGWRLSRLEAVLLAAAVS